MAQSEYPPRLVRDLMSVGVLTCGPDTPIQEIAKVLSKRTDLEELVVLEEGHNIGVVGNVELATVYAQSDWSDLTAGDILRSGVVTVPPDIPITAAAQIMLDNGVRTLYLTHHAGGVEYPAAFISFQHLVRHIAAKNQEDLNDLGIEAQRQSPLESYFQKRDAAKNNAYQSRK
jgi:CBS domain-containing protein